LRTRSGRFRVPNTGTGLRDWKGDRIGNVWGPMEKQEGRL